MASELPLPNKKSFGKKIWQVKKEKSGMRAPLGERESPFHELRGKGVVSLRMRKLKGCVKESDLGNSSRRRKREIRKNP